MENKNRANSTMGRTRTYRGVCHLVSIRSSCTRYSTRGLSDSKQRDISDFNVNQFPSTSTHKEQKLKSLEGIERFLFEALCVGEQINPAPYHSDLNEPSEWGDGYWISTEKVKSALLTFDKHAERYEPLSNKEIISSIKRVIPSVELTRKSDADKMQRRGIEFPSLTRARKDFERAFGLFNYEWDE